ncbi:MAG: hypothetical protein JXR60_00385 [Bacteroidales bacterium]|nr:hypothetical protein [Bacteroidales bacterium]
MIKPWESAYATFNCNPIAKIDPNGNNADEYNLNIETGETEKVSNKGGKDTQYININDGSGSSINTVEIQGSSFSIDYNSYSEGGNFSATATISGGNSSHNLAYTSSAAPLVVGNLAIASDLTYKYGFKSQVQLFNKGYFEGQTLKGASGIWKQTYNGGNGVGSVKAMKSAFKNTAITGKGLMYSNYLLNGISGGFIAYDAMTNSQYGEGFGGWGYEFSLDAVGFGLGFTSAFPLSMAYFKIKPTLKVANDDQVTKASLYTGYRPIPNGYGPDAYKKMDKILDSMWNEKTKRGQTRTATW